MAKFFTGKDGSLRLGDSTVLKVTDWSLQAEVDMLETTSLADNDRAYTPGVRSFSGSATVKYYVDDTDRNDAATLIKNVARTGTQSDTPIVLTFRLSEGSTNHDVKLNAFVSSASYGANVGEVVSAQISFRGTGALTEVTL